MLRDVEKERIRYSQRTISKTFSDSVTPVEAWMDALPYNLPLTVVALPNDEYLSLDNRRIFSSKQYSPHSTTQCVVYQVNDAPTELISNCGIDQIELLWRDSDLPLLHHLILRANTMAGVVTIRCAAQDSTFPLDGRGQPHPTLGQRTFDAYLYKIKPAKYGWNECTDPHQAIFQTAPEVFIRIETRHNSYHQRNDLRDYIVDHPNDFEVLKYERCDAELIARGHKNDDWDELLLSISQTESCTRDEYEEELFNSLELYCEVYQFDMPSMNDSPKDEQIAKEQQFVNLNYEELLRDFNDRVNLPFPRSFYSVEIKVANSIDFVVRGRKAVQNLSEVVPEELICKGEHLIYRKDSFNYPTLEYDPEAKSNITTTNDADQSLVIVIAKDAAVAIVCTKEEKLGLSWTTKHCFGFTSRGRCKNRRQTVDMLGVTIICIKNHSMNLIRFLHLRHLFQIGGNRYALIKSNNLKK